MRNSGLEPECFIQTLESESSASTNSASSASNYLETLIIIDFQSQCQIYYRPNLIAQPIWTIKLARVCFGSN